MKCIELTRALYAASAVCVLVAAPSAASAYAPSSVALTTAPTSERSGPRDDAPGAVVVTPEQELAVERGLAWLAEHQAADGSWVSKVGFKLNNDFRYTADDKGHLGVTSLAGMAFLAGGHLPGRGKYGKNVDQSLKFVLSCVQEDGYITFGGTRMYDHAFATLFLAEVYGMTSREDVKVALQKAVDFIVKSQNAQGGWRYEPYSNESDMSIVVCQVIALRAARNIGIRVPRSTVERAARYVVDSSILRDTPIDLNMGYQGGAEIGTFRYQREHHSRTSFPLTAAGVTALHGLGIYSDELIKKGLDYLQRNLTSFNREPSASHSREKGHYYFWYGHYYGVQAMYTAGSPYWEPYFEELRSVLLQMQLPDGSWPNDVGPGPAFGTAVGVLILEIPYRFLPIFQR
ncbi:MAG: prenyltransferase/squalene oxidase repeat-containing protein [Planctomycetota bacterium]|nr:prenyltransferase/squalene oxidase repeat-containing protein [Planctomycetota bacterium]